MHRATQSPPLRTASPIDSFGTLSVTDAAPCRAMRQTFINGATGINYFVHEWQPSFREDAVFRYPDVVAEIKRPNQQLQDFAPLLNGPTIENAVRIAATAEVAYMVKRDEGFSYFFAANMEKRNTRAKVSIASQAAGHAVVVDEDRKVSLVDGAFEDRFGPYKVHIYKWQR